jgi:deoxyxylulose-5-phosphate synthase
MTMQLASRQHGLVMLDDSTIGGGAGSAVAKRPATHDIVLPIRHLGSAFQTSTLSTAAARKF